MSLLIAFHGGYGSGKSTAIEQLKTLEIGPVFNVKFATPLYQIQEFVYKVVAPVYQRPADFVKDRKLLQWLGTDWGRATIGENVWVDIWKDRVTKVRAQDQNVNVVCDDCRFDNEAAVVQALGGYVVKIVRSNADTHAQGGTGIAGHASEAGLDPAFIDFTIENNGTVEDLKESLRKLVEQIKATERVA